MSTLPQSVRSFADVRLSLVVVLIAVLGGTGSPVWAASLGGARAAPSAPAQAATPPAPEPDSASRSVAARSRMLECGHQWSSMKKAGTATGTWKDFSRGCLAQR